MNIITMTLYPAIDIHKRDMMHNREYPTEHINYAGKGINVSRALHANGIESTAYVTLGILDAHKYLRALAAEGLPKMEYDTVAGRVRRNVHVHTDDGDFVVYGKGACANKRTISRIKRRFENRISSETYIVFSGALPDDKAREAAVQMLSAFREAGAKIILDSRSFTIREIKNIHPYLIKPNEDEFRALADLTKAEMTENDGRENIIVEKLEMLVDNEAENVLLTLGADGAYFIDREHGIYRLRVPDYSVVSTTGAGDFSVAGFLTGIHQGLNIEDTLRYSMAFSSSACMRAGTEPPTSREISDAIDKIEITKVK